MHYASSHEPFRAYGIQARFVFAIGVDPPAVDWGDIGIFKLMRHNSGSSQDTGDYDRVQDQHRDKQNERKKREKKCKDQAQC